MNWQIFGIIGYLSVLLGVAAVASWLVYWKKPARWLVNAALIMAVTAWFASRIHSTGYISRIEIDPSDKLAELQARQKAKEQALIDSRNDEVAQVQFAEDAKGEAIDTAGMDDADLKYLKAISEGDSPEWKKEKKQRGSSDKEDDSLEGQIGAKEKTEGADVKEIEKEQRPDPILLKEPAVVLANRLDLWNLRFATALFWTAIAIAILDYLRRANIHTEASPPIPLPSAWLHAITPLPPLVQLPPSPRRSIPQELSWLTRRGDRFLLFTDKPGTPETVINTLKPLSRWPWQLDLIHLDESNPFTNNEFVLESLWYHRASFIVDSPDRASHLLGSIIRMLTIRQQSRARCAQAVHIVWDMNYTLPEEILDTLSSLAAATGFSLVFTSSTTP